MFCDSLFNLLWSKVFLFGHIKADDIFDIAFKMFQVDWKFIFLSPHWVKAIITVPELNDLFSVACSYCIIIHNCNILNQLNQSSLHVPSVCSFDSSINDTLTASHCVEKEFGSCKAGVETVFDEASCLRSLKQSWKMGQRSFSKAILDSFTADGLLTNTTDHLT